MLTFTDRAREVLSAYLDQDDVGEVALRIAVAGTGPAGPRYELALVPAGEKAEDDQEIDADFVKVLVDEKSAPFLEGATVDFVERVNESGFQIRTASPVSPLHEPPKGEIADKVREVLDTQVNPAVASHGGSINLVDVQGTEIYIEMLGGCQGCAMSRMTLRQGVERALREVVPEVTAVHDVTDHTVGENPYF